jgi:hypothetical protein
VSIEKEDFDRLLPYADITQQFIDYILAGVKGGSTPSQRSGSGLTPITG